MHIYTSYFAKVNKLKELGVIPINVSLYPPKGWKGIEVKKLMPLPFMLSKKLSHEEYTKVYRKDILNRVNVTELIQLIHEKFGDKDIAFICYESPEKFCHRHLIADWITEQTGIEVTEYKFIEKRLTTNEIIIKIMNNDR